MTGKDIVSNLDEFKDMAYWYGGKRQIATLELAKQLKADYPGTWTDNYYNKAIKDIDGTKRVCDCSGMVCKCYGISDIGSSQIKNKYPVWTGNPVPGLIAWKSGHVGIITDDDGTMAEMRGIDYDFENDRNYKSAGMTYLLYDPDIDYTEEEKAPMTEEADEKTVWDYLMEKIENPYGVAGLMGNIYAESALIPINLQNSFESKLGYTDKTYTQAVDSGTYTKFLTDGAGYGLCQWTYSTRKAALKAYCDEFNASVGNLGAQLGYLIEELENDYPGVMLTLKNALSVKEASDYVLISFEKPADQSDSVKEKRAAYGQGYYEKYAYAYDIGWHQDENGWWYAYGNTIGSYYKSEWQVIEGRWFWFDAEGYIATGIFTDDNGDIYAADDYGLLQEDREKMNGSLVHWNV